MIRLAAFSLVAGAAFAGIAQASLPPVSVTYADQVVEARELAVEYLASGAPYGPILNPGTPDQAIVYRGHPLQLQYLDCIPMLEDKVLPVRWYEDGSVDCR